MKNYDAVAIVHRIFQSGERKKGGADIVLDYLIEKNKKILLIEHPLKGLKESGNQEWNEIIVSSYTVNGVKENLRIKMPKTNNIIYWITEVVISVIYLNKIIKNKPIFISSDPLNSLTGIFLRKKFSKMYHHSVDYSSKRFDNFLLNCIYFLFLRMTFRYFDIISINSLKTKRKYQQIECSQTKLFFNPNSPVYKNINTGKKESNTLVYTSGAITEKYDYDAALDIIKKLKREIKNIKLYAVGELSDKKYLQKLEKKIEKNKLQKNIIFTGFLNSARLKKLLVKSKVGLSFYSGISRYYTRYGDSLKIREYALYGIPTVSDGNSATNIEIVKEKAGFITNDNKTAYEKIRMLLLNRKIYQQYRDNCLKWAKKMDKKKILDQLYRKLYESG